MKLSITSRNPTCQGVGNHKIYHKNLLHFVYIIDITWFLVLFNLSCTLNKFKRKELLSFT